MSVLQKLKGEIHLLSTMRNTFDEMESKSLDMRDQLISLQNGTGTYEMQGTYEAFTPKASINLKIPNRLSMEDTPFSKLSRGSMDSNGPTQRTPVRYSMRSNSPINYNAVT